MINGTEVLPGAVENLRIRYGATDFNISARGRDRTKEILKEDLPPNFNVKGPISLKRIMELTLDKTGLDYEVVDEIGDLDDFTNKEIATEYNGATVWEFWSKLAEKRQCLITKNRKGQLVIFRPGSRVYTKQLRQLKNDPDGLNNIIAADGGSDDSGRRKEWNIVSQANVSVPRDETPPAAGEIWTQDDGTPEPVQLQNSARIEQVEKDLEQADAGTEVQRVLAEELTRLNASNPTSKKKFKTKRSQTSGTVIDNSATDGTRWETAENPSDDDECERLAQRKLNTSRVESVSYQCTTPDLEADDGPWESGYLVPVIDEIADVNATMLIDNVEFLSTIDKNGKVEENCILTLTIPDAYGDDANPSATQTQVTVIGENFNLEPLQ
jgi:prophage tail gpP-like protein